MQFCNGKSTVAGRLTHNERGSSVNRVIDMLTRFETKGDRVYGLSFHPKRPWILASLHSGTIQLWDYRMGTLVDKFDKHEGPVRGVHFHSSKPLFVSGGDDKKVRVWNYEKPDSHFTLIGHRDCIRTVQFHAAHPWIVSACDDKTIRLWNWQSQTCLCILGDHKQYVTCASFHPKDNLLVSASGDHLIRIWDMTLRNERAHVVVRQVLDGHKSGVNWVSFHSTSTQSLMASGADDNKVILWGLNDRKAWIKLGIMEGHKNSVYSIIFYPKKDLMVSNSEDSICIWNYDTKKAIETIPFQERVRMLAVHPEVKLIAAGHDSGLIILKPERERPAFSVCQGSLFYVKDWFLRCYDFSTQTDRLVIQFRHHPTSRLNLGPHSLACRADAKAVLISFDGWFEFYPIPEDRSKWGHNLPEFCEGYGCSGVFVARNQFAVLNKASNSVVLRNSELEENKILKTFTLHTPIDGIFYAETMKVLCKGKDKVIILDMLQSCTQEIQTPVIIKYIRWSNDRETVALLSKHAITIASNMFKPQCSIEEKMHVKSGAWDENGVFIYSTLYHIKYCLPNGESGIVRTLERPIYIAKVSANTVFCLDRNKNCTAIIIDPSEYLFKLNLMRGQFSRVMSPISKLCGQATIAYLREKGFPHIALHMVQDEKLRCNLALQSGNIQIALASAEQINEKDLWNKLGVEALRQGKVGMSEYAYKRAENLGRLSFLHLITGNVEKLSSVKFGEVDDVSSQLQAALYMGDVRKRVQILESAGHYSLAYITSSVHGLHKDAERLAAKLGRDLPRLPVGNRPLLLMPPTPVMRGGDWPQASGVQDDDEAAEGEELDAMERKVE